MDAAPCAPAILSAAASSASLSGVLTNSVTSDSFGVRVVVFLFGITMVQISRRVSTRMLRSLLRTAACSSVSDATGSGLAGRPRPRGGGAPPPESASLPPSPACPRSANRCLGRPPLSISSELLPTQSSRRRVPVSVPPLQPTMLLMSRPVQCQNRHGSQRRRPSVVCSATAFLQLYCCSRRAPGVQSKTY